MGMGRIGIAVGVLALMVASCAPPGPDGSDGMSTVETPTTETTMPVESPSTGELDMIVLPVNGVFPPDLIVGCPNGPSFPFSVLAAIETIGEDDADGFLTAIEPFLQSEEGGFWPQEDWKVLDRDGERATLVAVTDEGSLAYMSLTNDSGSWRWSGASTSGEPCELQYQVPSDLNVVDWVPDPNRPAPTPDSTVIDVQLTERECVGGMPIGDRLVGPQVVMTDSELHLAFAAMPPPGEAHDCQGNPSTPYQISLPGPLGEREIVLNMSIGQSLEEYLGD
jgi:hypothetical protein